MKHGGNIAEFSRLCGCSENAVIDFSSNINPRTPKYSLKGLNIRAYYEPSYKNLKRKIAKTFMVDSSNVALFNGASRAIFSLFETLSSKDYVLYAPLYGEYERAAALHGKNIQLINRFDDIYQLPPKKSIVVFVNPSTPDGRYYDLKRLLKIWKQQSCKVVIDESFLLFTDQESVRELVHKNSDLFVVQSLSKIYGAAGVRVGAIFSHSSNVEVLTKRQEMWSLSTFDTKFLLDVLSDKKHLKKSKKNLQKDKKELETILQRSLLFSEIFPSEANYILVKLKQYSAKQLQKKLIPYKILVRDCSSFDFLDNSFVRFAVKDSSAHKKLKRALDALT